MAETFVGVYTRLVGAQIRSQAQYRTSFALDLFGQTMFTVADYLTIIVMFAVTPSLAGFPLPQVLLITSISATGFLLADLTVGNVERIKFYVRTGLPDAMLIRPRRILPQLLAVDFQLRRVGRVLFAIAALIVSAHACGIAWHPHQIVLLCVAPLAAAVFFASIFVGTASVAFWWIESGEFANSLTYGGREFTGYPINIYDGLFRRVFSYALGFGFVAYYPALFILGVPDPLGMPTWFGLVSPAVAAVAAGGAAFVWRAGIRHYKGTGS